MLGKTQLISLSEKALSCLPPESLNLNCGCIAGREEQTAICGPYPWIYSRMKKHKETDFPQVQHMLMCFTDLQEQSECFN